jgi:hypothetical protein
MKQKLITILVAIVALLGGGAYVANNTSFGSVGGIQATIASSTSQTVTIATVRLLYATSSACTSRVISTQAGNIRLTFNDKLGARPTNVFGVLQTASTTVVYDAEQYGCGAVYVYPYETNTLTVLETQ